MNRLYTMLILAVLTVLMPFYQTASAEPQPLLYEVETSIGSGVYGLENGEASSASFREPSGIAIHSNGSIAITDTRNHLIRWWDGSTVDTHAGWRIGGTTGGLLDGSLEEATFQSPQALAWGPDGELYVADTGNHAIRKITADGVTTIAGDGVIGSSDGVGSSARFYTPRGLAVDSAGTIYVADTLNHVIRRITPDGMVTTLNAASDRLVELHPGYVERAGDYRDGKLSEAKFNEPTGLVIDATGNLYVSDSGNHVIRYINFQVGRVITVAGHVTQENDNSSLYREGGYVDGPADKTQFRFPQGLALNPIGGLVIADSRNHVIRYLYKGQVSTLAGIPDTKGFSDGLESRAQFHAPSAVAVDQHGQIWVSDSFNQVIRRLLPFAYPEGLVRSEQLQLVYNGNIVIDRLPVTEDFSMIAVSALAEAWGVPASVQKDEDGQSVIQLTKDDIILKLTLGQERMEMIGERLGSVSIPLPVVPYADHDNLYLPLRTVFECLGYDVQWNEDLRTVIIRD